MGSVIVLIDEYGILVLLNLARLKFASNAHNVSNIFNILCTVKSSAGVIYQAVYHEQ